jgi:hypothetical protein
MHLAEGGGGILHNRVSVDDTGTPDTGSDQTIPISVGAPTTRGHWWEPRAGWNGDNYGPYGIKPGVVYGQCGVALSNVDPTTLGIDVFVKYQAYALLEDATTAASLVPQAFWAWWEIND